MQALKSCSFKAIVSSFLVIYLPPNLERSIKIMKGALPLGVVLDAEMDKGINGCIVKSICNKKAIARDGRVQVRLP